ncbi:hypothetical protein [Streptomyces sp. MZ04]|uniref:hypothetical protein n=1 Tax=Streptomyces sp. MZ04 TaxID=2559236 RepID=UPI00107E6C91|nr:hypothetical protein [Streptomyces sp. MZ04]TGB09249.1 hypothetical protein E2651_16790 [Streptomyces sp. MZ04]
MAAIALSATGEALAASNWQDTWKTKGHKQVTAAHHVSKGKHFLHFGIKGNGRHKYTAKAYRVVGGKGGSNDVLMQTVKDRDLNRSKMANWKKYPAGSYYIVFSYSVKGKKAFGGIQ